jgi:type IV pilus assembly protein PilC
LPLVGKVMIKTYLIQISRTLSAILSGGIPLVTALEMVADAMTNPVIAARIREVRERVKEGVSLASALEKTGFIPRLTLEMVSVGEATGALEQLLMDAAEFHEEELDLLLARVTTWVEPLLLLFMGTIVAAIVIIMYLPVFNLAGTIR